MSGASLVTRLKLSETQAICRLASKIGKGAQLSRSLGEVASFSLNLKDGVISNLSINSKLFRTTLNKITKMLFNMVTTLVSKSCRGKRRRVSTRSAPQASSPYRLSSRLHSTMNQYNQRCEHQSKLTLSDSQIKVIWIALARISKTLSTLKFSSASKSFPIRPKVTQWGHCSSLQASLLTGAIWIGQLMSQDSRSCSLTRDRMHSSVTVTAMIFQKTLTKAMSSMVVKTVLATWVRS